MDISDGSPNKLANYLNGCGYIDKPPSMEKIMTTVNLFEDRDLGGWELTLTRSDPDLRDNYMFFPVSWNDEAESVSITGGTASFYQDINYDDAVLTLGPGEYNLTGEFINSISSVAIW